MKDNRLIASFLGFICAVVLVLALKELKTIFIPLIFAVLLSIILSPAIKFLTRFRIPRVVSVIIVVLALFFALYLLGMVIYASFANFIQEAPKYEQSLRTTLETTLKGVNLQMEQFQDYISKMDWEESLQKLSIGSTVSSTVGSFLTFIGYVVLVLIFIIFMLSGQFNIGQKLKLAFETHRAKVISDVIEGIQSRVRTYLVAKILISAMTAFLGVIIIILFGVDFVVVAGVLLFILNFIPNIGSIIASLFPVLICFVQYGYSWKVPGLLVCLIAVQMTFGNVVEPLMLGRGLNLSPIVVILSLVFWGWVWGLVGMVLAVPLTSTMVIIFENIDTLRPIAVMMSGKKSVLRQMEN